MNDDKPKPRPAPAAPFAPPKLDRVPEGYRPPPVRSASPTPVPQGGVAGASPAAAPPPRAPQGAPGASTYGLAAREVGADAAIAAGLAAQGTLGRESALGIFALAAVFQATGRLTLAPEGKTYGLSFRRGTVDHASSSDPADDLGRFLVAKGALRPDGLARAEAAKASCGGDLVTALIAERVVNPGDVAQLLQEHGGQIVQRALGVEGGGWSWNPQAPPVPGAFPLGNPFAMLCAAVRGLDAAALVRRLGDREHRAATRIGGRLRLEDLRLTPQEARVAGFFDGVRSPAEVASASPGDALVALRLAVLLGDVQLLSFGASRKGVASPPPSAAAKPVAPPPPGAPRPAAPAFAGPGSKPPAAPPPGARPTPLPPSPTPSARPAATPVPVKPAVTKPATTPAPAPALKAALDPASLQALFARLEDADYFAVLGVKPEATSAQIKVAYFQLAKAYHPDAVPTDAPPAVKKLCADVFAKVSGAWSVLGEDASRAAYKEQLAGGGAADVDVARIFEAEKIFETGTLLVKSRSYAEALKKFEAAIALNADEPEFEMWRAWCEFLVSDDKRRKLPGATGAIDAALKRNPRCAQGYLFLGQMAKIAGDLPLAEKHLKRGLDVAPDHVDLRRELKYLKK